MFLVSSFLNTMFFKKKKKKEMSGPGGIGWLYLVPLENNGPSMKSKSFRRSRCGKQRKGEIQERWETRLAESLKNC